MSRALSRRRLIKVGRAQVDIITVKSLPEQRMILPIKTDGTEHSDDNRVLYSVLLYCWSMRTLFVTPLALSNFKRLKLCYFLSGRNLVFPVTDDSSLTLLPSNAHKTPGR